MKGLCRKLRNRTLIYFLICAVVIAYLWLCFNGMGLSCVFERYFGFRCVSCGATTAIMRLVRLDFIGAVKANMLFTLVIYPAIAFVLLQDYIYAVASIFSKREHISFVDKLFKTKRAS